MIEELVASFEPDVYRYGSWCVLDFETTNIDKGSALNLDNRLIIAEIRDKDVKISLACDNEMEWYEALKILYNYDFIIMHGAKFELHWLLRLGFDISTFTVYDTLLAEFSILGNRKAPLDLDSVARRYGEEGKESYVSMLIKAGICPSTIDRRKLVKYCRQDIRSTLSIFNKQLEILEDEKLFPVVFTKNKVVLALVEMEARGLFLDRNLLFEIHREKVARYNVITEQLASITGGINMASPKQVGAFIYDTLGIPELMKHNGQPDRTISGGRRTSEEFIERLKPRTKEQRKFLELKMEETKLRKIITTYLTPFKEACEGDCIIHGSLNQSIAGTHRLTSSSPNLQNFDRTLKRVFIPRKPGWMIRQLDYSKIEFVVAGFLHRDPVILDHVLTGKDIHKTTAAFFEEKPESEVTKEERTRWKPETFSPLYGKISGTKKQQEYYQFFRDTYKATTEGQNKDIQYVLEHGKLKTATGLTFYFPNTEYTRSGYITNSPAIRDYPTQYLATGEIALIGVCLLYLCLKRLKLKSFLINTQHDSAVVEEFPEESGVIDELYQECMVKGVLLYLDRIYGIQFDFPIAVDSELKSHW